MNRTRCSSRSEGLSNVTLGYGFIVDRFTNMLHYPDQKLLGMQFYLNDLSPAGITLQLMGADLRNCAILITAGLGGPAGHPSA